MVTAVVPFQNVALVGESAVGKTVAAAFLEQELPDWHHATNSAPLYKMYEVQNGLPLGTLASDSALRRVVRSDLERIAEDLLMKTEGLGLIRMSLHASTDPRQPLVVNSVRHSVELDHFRKSGKSLIVKLVSSRENRIARVEDESLIAMADNDKYEQEIAAYAGQDYTLENNGTLEEFFDKIRLMAQFLRGEFSHWPIS